MNNYTKRGIMVLLLAGISLLSLALAADSTIMGSPFTDNMVLQRDQPLKIWGWSAPGKTITVSLAGQAVGATADKAGYWLAVLKPLAAGGPYEMTITGREAPITNILLGDVWVCSGQSNMQFGLNLMNGFHPFREGTRAPEHVARAQQPGIRLFCAPIRFATEPDNRYPEPEKPSKGGKAVTSAGQWLPCTPENALIVGPWGGFSAVAFYFGLELQRSTDIPIGLIQAASGGTSAEAWTSPEGIARLSNPPICPTQEEVLKKNPSALTKPTGGDLNSVSTCYNAVIHPLVPLSLKGVIWYQGENNSGDWHYDEKLSNLIADWRTQFNSPDLPFGIVQLCNYENLYSNPTQFASARDAQLRVHQETPNTGLVVTMDLYDWRDKDNIHPTRKEEVGRRLALWALRDCYGRKDVIASGPTFKAMTIEKSRAILTFDNLGGGLWSPESWMAGFTIAGPDGIFFPARATIKGDTVEVSANNIKAPRYVRYGWDNFMECTLYNNAGLPASPFRTDKWKPGVRHDFAVDGRIQD
ncbi:MAG: hypothetical protein HQL31_01370 [Planctomycetes bacterium]|nr:hypothetical protein [Planctomycetota bacterium]